MHIHTNIHTHMYVRARVCASEYELVHVCCMYNCEGVCMSGAHERNCALYLYFISLIS